MEKENIYKIVKSMIISSTHQPKFMSISTVKIANLMDMPIGLIEDSLNELVAEGRLLQSKLKEPPYREIYLLPEQT